MLYSLFFNNKEERFTVYVMHSSLSDEEIEGLRRLCSEQGNGSLLEEVKVNDGSFADAPTLLHYTKEMYYRLLAFRFLPNDLQRILYLDPDILVLNPVRQLYELDMENYLYAAAYHDKISIKEINKLRLNQYKIEAYYNSGVLLMNLELQRELIHEQEIYDFVENNRAKLIMPDQDIINALYAKQIKSLDEMLYNYDARNFRYYKITSNGEWDMEHVIENTVFVHFCGKKKPWKKDYTGKFHALYKYFEKLTHNVCYEKVGQ
jgi:lipopolysaccharide biosynthesis glycosyltransferase